MLSITVEVIILRDRLVNSGTSLIWKVSVSHAISVRFTFLSDNRLHNTAFLLQELFHWPFCIR